MEKLTAKNQKIFEDMKQCVKDFGLKDLGVVSIDIATTGEDRLKDKITSVVIGAPDHTPLVIDLTQPRPEEIVNFLEYLLGRSFRESLL